MAKKRMSKEGFEKLENELAYLITVRRAEVAQKLKEARAFGDLSENAEYDEAKNEQGILEATIADLQHTVANAEVIENISVNEVGIGSVIKIKEIGKGTIQKVQICGTNEAAPEIGKISDESPIGHGAMKKKVGDIFRVEAPIGEIKFEILDISNTL